MAASPIVPNFQDPNAKLRVYTESDVKAINEELQRSRADRVRAALFPETVGDPSKIPSLQMHRDVPTAIQFLSPPCLELRDAIADIINYQLDADFAQKFIPEIVKLLGDPDPDVVRNAAELTKDLTNSEAACTVATKSPQLVSALMRAANNASDDNKTDLLIKAGVAGALLNLTKYDQGRLTLFKSGGITVLVKLLGSPAERVVNYAISALHDLMTYQEGTKTAVRLAGGIQKMVPLLRSNDQKFLAVNIDCLHLLAFGDQDAKLAIWNCNGPRELVAVFRNKQAEEQLVWTSIRLLKVLSTCPHNKEQIVDAGGFEAIINRLDNQRDTKMFFNFLTTLRNLSDAEISFRLDDADIAYLLQFLKNPDEEVVMFMAGILANLSAEKPKIKHALYRVGSVELFLQLIMYSKNGEILENCLMALRHLTAKHSLADEVQQQIRGLGGLELAIQHFQLATTWPMVKVTCGLIRNLVNFEENHQTMVELKVIPRLGQILALAIKEEKSGQSQNSLKRDQSLSDSLRRLKLGRHLVDGVDLDDVIESSIATLANLAHESMINKENILDLNVGPLLMRLEADLETSAHVAKACRSLLEELDIISKPRGSIVSNSIKASDTRMSITSVPSSRNSIRSSNRNSFRTSTIVSSPDDQESIVIISNDQQEEYTQVLDDLRPPIPPRSPDTSLYANMTQVSASASMYETVVDDEGLRSHESSMAGTLRVKPEEEKSKKKLKKDKKEKKEKKEKPDKKKKKALAL